jgi:two-component system CheB/CheR fusion protein
VTLGPDGGLQLVVIGSSAGGVEALTTILGTLTPRFPGAIVLAQHLDPDRPSHLTAVLGRRSAVPLTLVEAQTTLEAGQVYVIPANRHVTVQDGHLRVEAHDGERPRPSIDLLLTTAAQVYGERLIAVILTGRGADGAAGAVDVKQAGGTVVVQNPQTAAFASMPLAVPPTVIDHVADLDAIGPLIEALLAGAEIGAREHGKTDAMSGILGLLNRHSSIDFRPYKPASLLRRIGRRMAILRVHSLEDYRQYLESHPEEVAELVMAVLIKVTEFFRDADAFAYLRREVIPMLVERGRARGRVLRIWSAGCATGEEAYSLALLVAETLGPELGEWTVKIFATDLDESAINFARRGLYPASVVRDVSAEYLDRYFEKHESGYRVTKALRQLVIFGQQDLSRGVPFPRIELAVCRNLLIYFQPELQQAVLDLFAYSLQHTQGYLFLGKAETARPSKSVFQLVNKRWKVYQCLAGPLPLPMGQSAAVAMQAVGRGVHPGRAPAVRQPRADGDGEPVPLRRNTDLLLRHVPAGVVMVDRAYRILSLNPAARRLLGVRDAVADQQDFLHTARGLPYGEVRAAIDRVLRDRTPALLPDLALEATPLGETRFVTLSFTPLPAEAMGVECVMITALDVSDAVQSRARLEGLATEHRRLTDDLGHANRRLVDTNKELQDANEELQAANEEMMLAQEELQATNEEFEATNEELQATNEELETNNEELQATNEELETTNEELVARTAELQETLRALQGEKLRQSTILAESPVHVVLLHGPGLVVETPAPLFGDRPAVGRGLDEIPDDGYAELAAGARQAYKTGQPWTGEARLPVDGSPGRFQVKAVPLRDTEGRVEGVILYLSPRPA